MPELRRLLLLALAAWPAARLAAGERPSALAAGERPSALAAGEKPPALRRWGSGEFRRFGFLVYEATLWAADDPRHAPLMLRLDYRRAIAGADIAAASVNEMRRTVADESRLRDWGARLARLFPDVKPGDHIVGHYHPAGAVFTQGERELGRIDDPDFARAFFGIWLDPRTSAPELRDALLGRGG